MNKSWIKVRDRSSSDYIKGVDGFLDFAFSNVREEDRENFTIRCPCNKCRNICFEKKRDVRLHLFKWGMYENYTLWEFHGEVLDTFVENDSGFEDDDDGLNMLQDACGMADMHLGTDDQNVFEHEHMPEEPNRDAQKFYRLLQEYQEPLTPAEGTTMSKLSYIVKLLHLKVLNNWSDSSFDSLLKLQCQAWGDALPNSYYEAKKLIKDLGLNYLKIDACQNDCILYWKEYENLNDCPTCGLSRWKTHDKGSSKGVKVPQKVLRYFPVKPRLQRLFMSRKTAKDMQWHKVYKDKVDDDVMRHPVDSFAWKSFDEEYKEFAKDARNVRLGLACDGFQPFNNSQHSTWPVVLIPYNLPPWLCMKAHSFMLTLLIPGPTSPGRNIDVYLQPLIAELKELWEDGIETYDSYGKENFRMRATVLWTISDFPAYGDLSGWCTKGYFACPCCHKETKRTSLLHKGCYIRHRRWLPANHKWRKDAAAFDNTIERGRAPVPLSGDDVLEHYSRFSSEPFGKVAGKKRKRDASNSLYGWHKKSIFFDLPYWRKLKIRHNLDVMHIEKNVSDNILGTLMSIKGKNKDTMKARIDLMKMNIRGELHPIMDGDKVQVPVACYSLSSEAKVAICDMFAKIKSPDGYLSNISRCVKDNGKKISCLKSHDHHVFIEQLLPIAIRGFLPKHVYEPLVELSSYFRNLCSKSITIKELEALERKIPYTLCKLEMIFPPAFFDVMVHLVIHLATEAKIAGPVRYRWMYPVERYLQTLKAYVRNRAHPEGSIAEGYLADECLTFCSRYMSDIDTKFNRKVRNNDEDDDEEGSPDSHLEVFRPLGRTIGQGVPLHLGFEECEQIHSYILNNCDELVEFVKEHELELERENTRNIEKRHKAEFSKWIHNRVRKMHKEGCVDNDLYNLVCGPSRVARRYSGYIVNGFRFHTNDLSENRKTQNYGVLVRGDDSDANEYYGVLGDILEIQYPGGRHVFVFKCGWFDVAHHGRGYVVDEYGLIRVNKTRSLKTDEMFVLESQVEQVFYIEDPRDKDWEFVIKAPPRDLYDMPSDVIDDEVSDVDAYQQVEVDVEEQNSEHVQADFSVDALATNSFMIEREAKVVDMVKQLIEETVLDNDFINDGEIEVFEDSSEEEEFDSDE